MSFVSTFNDIIELINESRLLGANKLYEELLRGIEENFRNEDTELILKLMDENSKIIDEMKVRANTAKKILETISFGENSDENESENENRWIYGMTMLGVTTHYKVDKDNGYITVRLEGLIDDLPLFEQLCVIHEVDLFKEWVPFCNASKMIAKLGQVELIAYISLYVPPLSRDTLLHAYGVDCLVEHSKVLIIGNSIAEMFPVKPSCVCYHEGINGRGGGGVNNDHDEIHDESDSVIPPVPLIAPGWFHENMDIISFNAVIEPVSTTSAKTIIVAQVNPKAMLPQIIVNFVIKNLAGLLLYYFQQQVVQISKDHECTHWQRIRKNKGFYTDWILPKLRSLCKKEGWDEPVIPSI